MIMADGSIKVGDFGASAAIDPHTGRVVAMPCEISEMEQEVVDTFSAELGSLNHEGQSKHGGIEGMAPYTLRLVTQVGLMLT
jgi:hypothetical protein